MPLQLDKCSPEVLRGAFVLLDQLALLLVGQLYPRQHVPHVTGHKDESDM